MPLLHCANTEEWRQEQWPDVPLAFIIGQDSLLTFPTWYEYETILDNAHLIVWSASRLPT